MGIKKPSSLDSPRQRVWQSMRVMRRFTVVDVSVTTEISVSTVHTYLHDLRKAGYVRKVYSRRRTGRGCVAGDFDVYLLVRNTGPNAPQVWRLSSQVWDANTDEVFDCGGLNHERVA